MTKKTKKAYNKWAKKYDLELNPHILLEHNDFIKLVHAQKNEKILDAASGTGRYSVEFYRSGAEVTGIDFSEHMIKVAKKKNKQIQYKLMDLTKKLLFADNTFDKVTCGQALKHIKNLNFTLKEFNRVLKKNGKLIFSVTHPEMDWTDYKMIKNVYVDLKKESNNYHHNFSDYLKAFEYSGFKIDKIIQLQVNDKIKHILTKQSYNLVKGRYECIIFRLVK